MLDRIRINKNSVTREQTVEVTLKNPERFKVVLNKVDESQIESYTPENRLRVTKTLIIPNHELKTPNLPYSSVDINLTKIGVVKTDSPF